MQVLTKSKLDIERLKAFIDTDKDELFDPAVDDSIAATPSEDFSFVLSPLDLKLPPEQLTYLFVAYDLALTVSDSLLINFKLAGKSDLVFSPPVDAISGEFADSPGRDLTDGMIEAQVTRETAPAVRTAPGDQHVLAQTIVVPSNGSIPEP